MRYVIRIAAVATKRPHLSLIDVQDDAPFEEKVERVTAALWLP